MNTMSLSEVKDSIVDDSKHGFKEDESPLLAGKEKEKRLGNGDAQLKDPKKMEEILKEMEAKYAAYVREDTYGIMGKGDLSIREKAILVLALLVLVPVKIILIFSILVTYYVICRVCTMFIQLEHTDFDKKDSLLTKGSANEEDTSVNHNFSQGNYANLSGVRRSIIVHTGRVFSRCLLFIVGFYSIKTTRGDFQPNGKAYEVGDSRTADLRPCAIVCNHVSYVDILYQMSASFPSFVAKRSVADLPLVGLISKCLGCIYVQREDKTSGFKGVSGILQKRLELASSSSDAPTMMLFPEGTTTNGSYILPFKTGAFLAGRPVQPVILKYHYTRFSPAWDSISGVRHVVLLLCQFINHLEAVWLPVYIPSEEEKVDPKLYANNVRKLMAVECPSTAFRHILCLITMEFHDKDDFYRMMWWCNAFAFCLQGGLILSDIGLPEKRIYHSFLNEYLSSITSG